MESGNVVIRYFSYEKDYAMIAAWWEAHGSKMMKPQHLPRTGIIIDINGQPVSAGFLYRTDSELCAFEFFVYDPNADKAVRNTALNALIDAAVSWAKDNGFSLVYLSTGIQKLTRRLQAKGFLQIDTGQSHMFREV